MNILLINPKISGGKPWIPLGMAYIASNLRNHGVDVKIIDNNFLELSRERLRRLIYTYQPDIIGTGGMTIQCNDALNIGRLVKSIDAHIPLVYGGVHFTFKPDDGLQYGDICVMGEGEEVFVDICHHHDTMTGIVKANFIQDLDAIPFPAYDLLDLDAYDDHLITGEKAISIMTGRGCPYNCSFCASPQLYQRQVRYHSLEYVTRHIEHLITTYDLKHLRIMDDTFTLNKRRVMQFCDKIEEHGFTLNMTCLTNVKNVDYDMFRRMKDVGFSIIAFGIESGNNDILAMTNKGITTDDAKAAVMVAKQAGLDTECLFMIGNVGETAKTVMDSINFAKEINPVGSNSTAHTPYNWFQFATPFPGSQFYAVAEQHGKVVTHNWDDYHHQYPVFVPNQLDIDTMVELRQLALTECNFPFGAV